MKNPGWRTYRDRYTRIGRELAATATAERVALANTVCPDGAACPLPSHQRARAAALAGADWQHVADIVYGAEALPC